MARVTVTDCLEHVDNRFQLVLVSAKRVRQLILGAEPLVEANNDKWTVVALREIAAGLIGPSILEEPKPEVELSFDEPIADGEADEAGETSEANEAGAAETVVPYREINLEQRSEQWKQWRRSGFGASEIHALMAQSPKSLSALQAEKAGQGRDYQSEAMRRGIELEPEARKMYCAEVGVEVHPLCVQHKKHAWARASLDGISDDRKQVVEIKCGEGIYEQARDGEISPQYRAQLQHILFVTGLETIDYWCYSPGKKGILIKVKREDASYMNKVIEVAERHQHLLADELPAEPAAEAEHD